MNPVRWQRVEGAACAVLALLGAAALGAWWWPLALFLAFDLSALGYLRGPRGGAFAYNVVHSYWGPAVLAGWAIAIVTWGAPGSRTPVLVVAAAWLFHVGVDRAIGYALKHDDDFQHTHLGWIGRASAREK